MAADNDLLLRLVAEQLQASGYARAASALERESGVAAAAAAALPAPAGSPAVREWIYEAILLRDAAGALRAMRSRYSQCLASRPSVAAELLLQCVCDAMLRGEPDAAVAIIGTQLLPFAGGGGEGQGATANVARDALEAASVLLAFPTAMLADAAQLPLPIARLLSGRHRAAVAARVYAALLQADGVARETDAMVLLEAVLAADAAIGGATPAALVVPLAAEVAGVDRRAVTGGSGHGGRVPQPEVASSSSRSSRGAGVGAVASGTSSSGGDGSSSGSGGTTSGAARSRVAPHTLITGGLRHGV